MPLCPSASPFPEPELAAFEYAFAQGLAKDPKAIDPVAVAHASLEQTLTAIDNDAWLAQDWRHLFDARAGVSSSSNQPQSLESAAAPGKSGCAC